MKIDLKTLTRLREELSEGSIVKASDKSLDRYADAVGAAIAFILDTVAGRMADR